MIRSSLLASLLAIPMLAAVNEAAAQSKDKDSKNKEPESAVWSTLDKEASKPTEDYDFEEQPSPDQIWEEEHKTTFFIGGALTFGGSELTAQTASEDSFNESIRSGELVYGYIGSMLAINDASFRTHLSLGYHINLVNADNGSVRFTRYPLDVIPTWEFKRHTIGVGMTIHFAPTLDALDAGGDKIHYDISVGTIANYKFKLTPQLHVGARFTAIEYAPKPPQLDNRNASHFGAHVEYHFN